MEPRGCNRWQSVAKGGRGRARDGKEGVDGSSPSEGFGKALHDRLSFRVDLQFLEHGAGMEPFMEPSGQNALMESRVAGPRRGFDGVRRHPSQVHRGGGVRRHGTVR